MRLIPDYCRALQLIAPCCGLLQLNMLQLAGAPVTPGRPLGPYLPPVCVRAYSAGAHTGRDLEMETREREGGREGGIEGMGGRQGGRKGGEEEGEGGRV